MRIIVVLLNSELNGLKTGGNVSSANNALLKFVACRFTLLIRMALSENAIIFFWNICINCMKTLETLVWDKSIITFLINHERTCPLI